MLAARLGDAALALRFGLSAPVEPPKGQIPVTERAEQLQHERDEVQSVAALARRRCTLGAVGPIQARYFSRCGMPPCQGRNNGPSVSAVIADELGRPISEIGSFRPRAPFEPITVASLANLGPGEP